MEQSNTSKTIEFKIQVPERIFARLWNEVTDFGKQKFDKQLFQKVVEIVFDLGFERIDENDSDKTHVYRRMSFCNMNIEDMK
jgi:hypothetical protein